MSEEMKMKTVWVVIMIYPSSQIFTNVFSTREKAKAFEEKYKGKAIVILESIVDSEV